MCENKNEQPQQEQDPGVGSDSPRLIELSRLVTMAHPDDFTWLDWEMMAQ